MFLPHSFLSLHQNAAAKTRKSFSQYVFADPYSINPVVSYFYKTGGRVPPPTPISSLQFLTPVFATHPKKGSLLTSLSKEDEFVPVPRRGRGGRFRTAGGSAYGGRVLSLD